MTFSYYSYNHLEGIHCYDGLKDEPFLLHAYVLSWSGDTLGLTKLMNLTGHNSYKGCHCCDIRGIYMNHVYFPTTPPIGEEGYETYNSRNLPLHIHRQFKDRIHQLNQASTLKERDKLKTEFGKLHFLIYGLYRPRFENLLYSYFLIIGIKGRSILFNLKSIQFPLSFPIDFMHLIYENIAGYMFKLWIRKFFPNGSNQDNGDYVFDKAIWKEIGIEMHCVRKTIPTYLG